MNGPLTASFWKHHPICDQDARRLTKRTIEFQQITGCGFVKITPAGTWQAVCHGAKDEIWQGDPLGRRRIMNTVIETPDDWMELIDFQTETPPLLKEMTECCRSVATAVASKPVAFTAFNPLTQAIQLAGLERFKDHCLTAPDKVRAGMERIKKNTLTAIDAFIEAGARGAYFVTQHMQKGLIDPDMYRSFGVDGDRACLARCAELELPMFHIHGESVFLELPDIPPNCIIHYELNAENISPEEFHVQHPYALMTGIPVSVMKACKSDTDITSCIDRYTESVPKSRFVTAGCALPLDFPESQIQRWVELCK
jgi:uroporphyrinogen decarboxylase